MNRFTVELMGERIHLASDPQVFSPQALDKGSQAMLSLVDFSVEEKVLDLGCGTGVIGILAAKKLGTAHVWMLDVDPIAVAVSRESLRLNELEAVDLRQSDAFANFDEKDFSLILSNPPYHVDFAVPKRMIEGAFRHLRIGGRLLMVTKRLDWYRNKIQSVFGGVRVHEIDGYYIFEAEKRSDRRPKSQKAAPSLSRKLSRKADLKKRKQK